MPSSLVQDFCKKCIEKKDMCVQYHSFATLKSTVEKTESRPCNVWTIVKIGQWDNKTQKVWEISYTVYRVQGFRVNKPKFELQPNLALYQYIFQFLP